MRKAEGQDLCLWTQKRAHKTKAESVSPTVHSDSVMLTALVDAHELRDVDITDVSGVQLNSHGVEPVSRKVSGVTPCEPDLSETIVLGFALDLI